MSRDSSIYEFERFRLLAEAGILEHDGERIPLAPKAFDTLLALVRNAGQVVDKDVLIHEIWPETYVVESGLFRNISILRRTLEEVSPGFEYIETIPKRGYRFVAQVKCTQVKLAAAEQISQVSAAEAVDAGREVTFVRYCRASQAMALGASLMLLGFLAWNNLQGAKPKYVATDRDQLIANHILGRTNRATLETALEKMLKAVEAKPDDASRWASLAEVYMRMHGIGLRKGGTILEKGRLAAERAVSLDPNCGAAQNAKGLHLALTLETRPAEVAFRKAVRLQPNSISNMAGLAFYLMNAGRFAEARELLRKAGHQDPITPAIGVVAGRNEYMAGQYHAAVEILREVLARAPDADSARYYLALALGELGLLEEARAELRKSNLQPGLLESEEAWLSALGGDRRPARELLAKRLRLLQAGRGSAIMAVLPATDAGETEIALTKLEEALQSRSSELYSVKVNPKFAKLRGHARFQELVQQVWPESQAAGDGQIDLARRPPKPAF